jgi:hypothetical protein
MRLKSGTEWLYISLIQSIARNKRVRFTDFVSGVLFRFCSAPFI